MLLLKKNKKHNKKVINYLNKLGIFNVNKYYLKKGDKLQFFKRKKLMY